MMKANGNVEEAELKERGREGGGFGVDSFTSRQGSVMGACKVGNGHCGSIQSRKRFQLLSD
jgi:hypothetical protein